MTGAVTVGYALQRIESVGLNHGMYKKRRILKTNIRRKKDLILNQKFTIIYKSVETVIVLIVAIGDIAIFLKGVICIISYKAFTKPFSIIVVFH